MTVAVCARYIEDAGLTGRHLLNLVLDRVAEQIPYSLVDVKPHRRTGINNGRVPVNTGFFIPLPSLASCLLYKQTIHYGGE